jgi:AraC-like DNA-binding protein
MSSPDFGPEALRRLVAMSRSKLYRIFEGTGGVARFIQDERLDAARQRLADIGDTTSIRAVAGEVGFLEHSTFSRAFKLRYGCSPREFREIVSDRHYLEARDDRHHADAMP